MDKKEQKKVNIVANEIDLPKIDVTKYIGKKVSIETADTYEGDYGYYVKFETKVLEKLGNGEKQIQLRGSRIFGLQEDSNGKVGFGKETKLGVFLAKYKCTTPKQMVGKEVILQTQTNKNGVDFLSFN